MNTGVGGRAKGEDDEENIPVNCRSINGPHIHAICGWKR
jgi:hypothetical protein